MFDRRHILKAGLTLAAAPAFKALAARPSHRRFVDVHCHFFNAADIPVRGFLQRVVLSDYAAVKSSAASDAMLLNINIWKGMVARLADVALRHKAPSPAEELNCLDGSLCEGFGPSALAAKSAGPSGTARDIADALRSHYQGPSEKSAQAPPPAGEDGNTDAFVDFVLREMRAKGVTPPASSAKSMRSVLSETAEAIGGFIANGGSFFSRYFDWAKLLTGYRETIAGTYYTLYDADHSRLILAAPAIVDYNYWLEDQEPSALSDQARLMARLSLRQPRPMHGFMAFDPLRAIRRKPGEPDPLGIVKEAVTAQGFLGVKLYSPMGFKPMGNAGKDVSFPAHAAMNEPGFGAKLDAALDSLYAWCAAEEVPILAHTTDSQSAGPDYATRAEPRFWAQVLAKYPSLKLNCAHFGNFSQAFAAEGNPLSRYSATWESEIAGFLKSGAYPNVYADISYFHWVLEGSSEKGRIKVVKALFGKYFETDPNVERLMFGTDWNMTGKAGGAARYLDAVEDFFRGLGLKEAQLDNLFYKNALRFLALGRPSKAMERLEAFYRAAGKPVPSFA
jgi:predicted TIM-barrel fold metal-dependent hydrolase